MGGGRRAYVVIVEVVDGEPRWRRHPPPGHWRSSAKVGEWSFGEGAGNLGGEIERFGEGQSRRGRNGEDDEPAGSMGH